MIWQNKSQRILKDSGLGLETVFSKPVMRLRRGRAVPALAWNEVQTRSDLSKLLLNSKRPHGASWDGAQQSIGHVKHNSEQQNWTKVVKGEQVWTGADSTPQSDWSSTCTAMKTCEFSRRAFTKPPCQLSTPALASCSFLKEKKHFFSQFSVGSNPWTPEYKKV